jgi:AAHS family 4-hydroxybenzoate transporter-like MFS transporter
LPSSVQPTVDVCEWLNRQWVGRLPFLVLCLGGACLFFEGFNALGVALVAPGLIRDLNLSPTAVAPAVMMEFLGLVAGCLVVAPLADRVGRRPVLLGSVTGFSVFSFATCASWSLVSLCAFRFLAGTGIGGGMAAAIAIVSEFLPERKRAALTVVTVACFPLGAAMGGIVAALLVPTSGWQTVFFVGGIGPVFVAMALFVILPESPRHLVARRVDAERVAEILSCINRRSVFLASTRFIIREEAKGGLSVLHLFGKTRAAGTVLIWTMLFMSLFGISLAVGWLPLALDHVGMSLSQSILVLVVLQFSGAVMCGAVAPLIERQGLFAILLPGFLVAAAGIAALGAVDDVGFLLIAASVAGIGIACGLSAAAASVAAFYPTYIRATGLGWALGVGIVGAAAGPAIGTVILALHVSRVTLFLAAVAPELVAFAAALALMRLERAPAPLMGEPQVSAPL